MYINVKEQRNKIYITELNQDYKLTFKEEDRFQPELFVESSFPESQYTSLIDGKPLEKIKFDSIRDFKDYKFKMKDLEGSGLYGDIPVEYQYIKENYSHEDKQFQQRFWFLDIETGTPKNGFPSPVDTPSPINLIQIAESDNDIRYVFGRLNMYNVKENETFFYYADEKEMLLAFKDFLMQRTPTITTAWNGDNFDFPYIINRTEKLGLNPEIFSPFGILEEHTAVMFGQKTKIRKPLGFYWVDYMEIFKRGIVGGQESWSLEHISKVILGDEEGGKLDYHKHGYRNMRAFINNDYSSELDVVENSELKKAFLNNDKELHDKLWYTVFVSYGIVDVDVLKAIDKKKGIINTLTFLGQTMSINFYDVFATVKPWQIHIYNELYNRNQFVPAKTPFDTYKIPGGHVFADSGLHKWVCSFDVRSLYPFCMISLNMSPETYIQPKDVPKDLKELTKSFVRYREEVNGEEVLSEDIYMNLSDETKNKITELLVKYNLAMSPNGSFYRKDSQGILPELTQEIYNGRKQSKKKQKEAEVEIERCKKEGIDYSEFERLKQSYNVKQLTQKTMINAEYGFIANSASNIANADLASGITAYGRYNLKKTMKLLAQKLNALHPDFRIYVCLADTDSNYYCFDSVVQTYLKNNPEATTNDIVDFLDNFCKKIVSPKIQEIASDTAREMNAMQDEILFEREAISDFMIVTGKKRYACQLLDDEGTRLTKPKRKVIGLEIKRSDTPANVKKALEKSIDLIFSGNNEKLIDFIELYKKNFSTSDIDKIAIPSGVSDITKFMDDSNLSLPQHVRASLVHNKLIKQYKLDNYPEIVNGDKIKFVFLRRNPITLAETIAYNDVRFLYDIGLDKYIDYDKMFNRSFMSPIETLTNAINWKTSANSMIMDLF